MKITRSQLRQIIRESINESKKKKLSGKQQKIARVAEPYDQITSDDFQGLRARKKTREGHDPDYDAPEGSDRDKKLDQTKKDLDRAKELRKDGKAKQAKKLEDKAYRRRRNMEKKEREKKGYKSKPRKDTKKESIRITEPGLREMIRNILSEISAAHEKSLKKKAKEKNAPLGALKAIYRKGLGAYGTSGSRPGQSPEAWAMGRVNSVLSGGKARKVDAAQWKQIQKHRKKKKNESLDRSVISVTNLRRIIKQEYDSILSESIRPGSPLWCGEYNEKID